MINSNKISNTILFVLNLLKILIIIASHLCVIKKDKEFPSSFENHVRKIIRLLFNVLAHIYQGHFREIVLLNLHSHLNCLFSHLVLFNDQFKLIDEKEAELLVDDVYQVNISEFQSRSQAMDVDVIVKSDADRE